MPASSKLLAQTTRNQQSLTLYGISNGYPHPVSFSTVHATHQLSHWMVPPLVEAMLLYYRTTPQIYISTLVICRITALKGVTTPGGAGISPKPPPQPRAIQSPHKCGWCDHTSTPSSLPPLAAAAAAAHTPSSCCKTSLSCCSNQSQVALLLVGVAIRYTTGPKGRAATPRSLNHDTTSTAAALPYLPAPTPPPAAAASSTATTDPSTTAPATRGR